MQPGITVVSPLTETEYVIVDTIGTGTYATCYAAKDLRTGEMFCLKETHFHLLDDDQKQNAAKEAELHSTLRCDTICKFIEAFLFTEEGSDQTSLFIVLELCECNLEEHIMLREQHRLFFDVATVLCLFLDVASALVYLHGRGVVHRDLAPKNLLCIFKKDDTVGRDLQGLKLCDFGVSAAEENAIGGMLKTEVGTPQTMSPEIIAGSTYGASADIWSAGCCFYEIFTLEPLFGGQNFPELIQSLDSWEGVSFDKRAHLEYEDLEFAAESMFLIGECLEKDPKMRPSAEQIEATVLEMLNKFAAEKQQDIVWIDFKEGQFLCNSDPPANSPESIKSSDEQLREYPAKKPLPERLTQIYELKKKFKQEGKKGGEYEFISGLPEEIERRINDE